jgi:hypothetical protein
MLRSPGTGLHCGFTYPRQLLPCFQCSSGRCHCLNLPQAPVHRQLSILNGGVETGLTTGAAITMAARVKARRAENLRFNMVGWNANRTGGFCSFFLLEVVLYIRGASPKGRCSSHLTGYVNVHQWRLSDRCLQTSPVRLNSVLAG